MKIETSLFEVATRFIGLREDPAPGRNNYLIQYALSICKYPEPITDETAWCSAILNFFCITLGLPHSGSAAARSWLKVGIPILLQDAQIGNDILILSRGPEPQPGPEVINAPGHVTIYAGMHQVDPRLVRGLGGNQGDVLNVSTYPISRILGVRRMTK